MPSIPDIPGKGLIGGTTKRVRVVAAAGAGAALAVGGVVAKRVLGHGGSKDEGAKDDGDRVGIEADDKVVPIAKEKAPAKPKPVKPKAAKPKPKAAAKPKADKAKPPLEEDPEHPEGGRPPGRENLDG